MKIIKIETFDDSLTWDEFKTMLFKKNIKIKNNQCIVLYCTKRRTVVLSNMNKLGGICDDCVGETPDKINSYEIAEF